MSTQNHMTLRIFSPGIADPEKEHRGPGSCSVFFFKTKIPHTFNNKGQNCIECELDDLPLRHMREHHLFNDIATSIT